MSPATPTSRDEEIDDFFDRRRGARRVDFSFPSLARGLAIRLAEQIQHDEMLTDEQKMTAYQTLPKNRAEARRFLRGRGPWGIAKRDG